ncbi:MAG: hypothetical protein H0X33_08600 [Taibaiella sp.]|nr:hypothetical protein [Taibaiella sp.]
MNGTMSDIEVMEFVKKSFPEFYADFQDTDANNYIYSLMQSLYLFTQDRIEAEDYKIVRKALQTVETIYRMGDKDVRNAIDSVFISSYAHYLREMPQLKTMVLSMTPIPVYNLYINHILHRAA